MEKLQRDYQFKNFVESIKFVNQVAELAEKADHHPDILIQYNKVFLTFYTHDTNSVTDKDRRLAAQTDEIFNTKT